MTIIEALILLRNDLRSWVAYNLQHKIDKEEGKGLSTNDYTDADKNKLDGIAENAEVNVQSDWAIQDESSDAFIKNKPTIPTVPDYLPNQYSLKFGDKSYNGSSEQTITAADLGLSQALKYHGISETELSDGSTTNPITILGEPHTAESGCVVFYNNKEFVWNGSAWEELGYLSGADFTGYATEKWVEEKKYLTEETYKGTVTSVTAGTGLTGGTITGSGTIAVDTDNYKLPTYAEWEAVTGVTDGVIGTVSSVGLTMPGAFTVTGSPITKQGTFNVTLNSDRYIPSVTDKDNWNAAEANVQSDWDVEDPSSDAFIKNKPTIPSAVTSETVAGWGFTKNTGTYSKPTGGIPKSDLSSDVQTSLGKADSALQEETYKGTVTSVKINDTSISPTNGEVNLGTVVKSALMSSTATSPSVSNGVLTIPTVGGTDGATFTPSVATDGTLSWTNDKNLTNPTSVNIKGSNGDSVTSAEPGLSYDEAGYTSTPITFTVGTTQLDPVTIKAKHGYTPVKDVDYFDGKSISSVTKKSGSGASGTTDIYSVKVDTTEVGTFNVYQGKDFKYEDFTAEQLEVLKGDPFEYSDFTAEQLAALQGPKGTGISYITGPVTQGKINTYTIHYTDETTSTFTVTDGADGTGVTILGEYESDAALKQAHPTGNLGDAYLVEGNLYVWTVESGWKNVGNILGPQGPQGPQGDDGREITSITSDATETDDYTSTKVTVAFNRGGNAEFIVNAKNGSDATVPSDNLTGSGTIGLPAVFSDESVLLSSDRLTLKQVKLESLDLDYPILTFVDGDLLANILFKNEVLSILANTSFDGFAVEAGSFCVTDSSDDYVLLAGGGTKLLSEIQSTESGFLPLTGGHLTGDLSTTGIVSFDTGGASGYCPLINLTALGEVVGFNGNDGYIELNYNGDLPGVRIDGLSEFKQKACFQNGFIVGDTTHMFSIDQVRAVLQGGTHLDFESEFGTTTMGPIENGFIISNDGELLLTGDSIVINSADSIYFSTSSDTTFDSQVYVTNELHAQAFYETSDARKKDIKEDLSLEKCYDLIDKCQTVIYSLKDQTKEQVGMIAQEIEEFFPEVVATDEEGFKSLAYDRLVVICFKVLKDIIKRLNHIENIL